MALAGLPRTNALVTAAKGAITDVWDRWMQALASAVDATTQLVGSPASERGAHASVTATALPTGALAAGLYRVSSLMQVTQVAAVSSSLTLTIGWTSQAQSFSSTGAALTANTLTTQQNGTVLMTIDAGTSITYAIAYVSSGTPAMQYLYNVRAERLP